MPCHTLDAITFRYFSGQEEVEEVQQSYSEYYQAGGGSHQEQNGGYNSMGGASHGGAANQSARHASSYEMTDMGGQNTMNRSATGTIPRTDVIVDTLAGSGQRGGNYQSTTTTTQAHHNDYEEQEQNMSFA